MDEQQIHILRHSLGLTYSATPYRNHFCTGEGGKDHADCMALVEAGMMERHRPSELSGGMDVFTVTEAGKAAAIAAAPKLTRAKSRYDRFLAADSGLTFGEWLKAGRYKLYEVTA